MSDLPILSISIFLPLASALYIILFVSCGKASLDKQQHAIYVTILSSALTLIATSYLLIMFDRSNEEFQFTERYLWVNQIGLEFYVGVDGISLCFVSLTAFLTFICAIASLFTIKKQIKEFLLCLLLTESLCIGAFSALNLLLFYLLFEATLIPMFFTIGVWGSENRQYAAIKFFIYTFCGSVFALPAIIYIYMQTHSFSIPVLMSLLPTFIDSTQRYLWIALFIAFAIKVPMIPLHTWLPDAHVQAPTIGSVILAGILLKLGAYGMLRVILPMLPAASYAFVKYVLVLSAAAVVYASLVALGQRDMKKIIAYSSIAHMGYVTGGIFSFNTLGINGAVFQMISHAIVASALFLIVGMLYERSRTKMIDEYGGVARKMPMLAVFLMISVLGAIGLPGTSGFIGEFLSILGVFNATTSSSKLLGTIIATGVVLSAIYMLNLYRVVMFGSVKQIVNSFEDLCWCEIVVLAPLVIIILYLGFVPECVMQIINLAVSNLAQAYSPVF